MPVGSSSRTPSLTRKRCSWRSADRRRAAERAAKPRVIEIVEIGAHRLHRHRSKPVAAPGEEPAIILEVAAIGGERVGCGPALGAHHFEKGLDMMPARTSLCAGCATAYGGASLLGRDAHRHFTRMRPDEKRQIDHRGTAEHPQNHSTMRKRKRLGMAIPVGRSPRLARAKGCAPAPPRDAFSTIAPRRQAVPGGVRALTRRRETGSYLAPNRCIGEGAVARAGSAKRAYRTAGDQGVAPACGDGRWSWSA